MRRTIELLQQKLSDPTKQLSKGAKAFMKSAVLAYEQAAKASIGMPTYTDSVTLQFQAGNDIPTVPLSGYQLVHRVCYVPKSATSGTTAGGFFATLSNLDLAPFVGSQSFFRVKSVTSWTVPRQDGNVNQGSFAGVSVPGQSGPDGTEALPIWSENFQPVGLGFAGIKTLFPLGDFPQYSDTGTAVVITNHYTSLGNTGGVTGVPVVFHVEIETLI